MKYRTAYVSGPMSGIPEYNFPAFHASAEDLRRRGWKVISPAELEDLEDYADGVTPEQYRHLLLRDLRLIAEDGVTDIIVLPGWEKSGGATAEVALGRALKLPILAYPEMVPVEALGALRGSPTLFKPTGEVRVTDPKTGGQKGVKPERLDLIPVEPLLELARVFGYGAMRKYEDHNYLKGYAWGLSIRALEHHILRWKAGRTVDEESGYHHLAHAAWHCFALMMFEWHALGTDDRICTAVFGSGARRPEELKSS